MPIKVLKNKGNLKVQSSITKQWIERADYDLETAKSLLKSKRYLYVAFMCQQCLEKLLKAHITSGGNNPPLVHNLLRLAKESGLTTEMAEDQKLLLADLNPFYIKARYGEYKDALSRVCSAETAAQFLKSTENFIKWLKPKIN